MLEDSRAEHRITAIWAVNHLGDETWLNHLAQMGESDPAAAIRRLAQAVQKQMRTAREAITQGTSVAAADLAGERNGKDEPAVAGGQK